MNDVDVWLNSLGIEESEATAQPDTPEQPQEVQPVLSNIPIDDFNSILADNGFTEPEPEEEVTEEAEAEEIGGEEDVNTDEGRDLDAEEDADWNRMEDIGVITPVSTENGDFRSTIQESEDNLLEAVQSVNEEDYPEHNPDEEQVSDNALEAFSVAEESQQAESQALPERAPIIPPNSPTLLLNTATSRFSGTEWYNEIQKQRVILAGLGGIGSYVSYNLARMNIAALLMYDDDVVEQVNMSGQLYCKEDVGKTKVDAMANMITRYTTMSNIYAIRNKFTSASEAGDIMICGFDSMTARRTFFTAWNNHVMAKPEEEERHKCLFLDGRLSIDTLQVFCITGENNWAMAEYADKYLFSDAEAEETQCSLKQTTYLACMIGSFIVNLFTNFVADLLNPVIPYDLPFLTEYDAQNMIFKTIK